MTTFNPDPQSIVNSNGIAFIHVGKCAGESIAALLAHHDLEVHEFHCFDADERIEQLLRLKPPHLTYLLAIRNPVDRIISAFNWGKHEMIKNQQTGAKALTLEAEYERFSTISDLADGLTSSDAYTRTTAQAMLRSPLTHMGLGLNWYVPTWLHPWFPEGRTFVVDTATIGPDLGRFADVYCPHKAAGFTDALPRCKADYKQSYGEQADTLFPTRLSSRDVLALVRALHAEMVSYSFWSCYARHIQQSGVAA